MRHCKVCKEQKDNSNLNNRDVCIDCLSVEVPCPIHNTCQYRMKKYNNNGSIRVKIIQHGHADETIQETGSIIHWTELNGKRVPVTCGICKVKRDVDISKVKFRREKYTGCHLSCFKTTWWRNQDGFGINHHTQGYIYKHKATFSVHDLDILKTMFGNGKNSENYVLEHRSTMALYIGRPLGKDEIVHHLDGNRSNNNIKNLRLLKFSKHHNGHGDDFYQPYQECLSLLSMMTRILVSASIVHK